VKHSGQKKKIRPHNLSVSINYRVFSNKKKSDAKLRFQ